DPAVLWRAIGIRGALRGFRAAIRRAPRPRARLLRAVALHVPGRRLAAAEPRMVAADPGRTRVLPAGRLYRERACGDRAAWGRDRQRAQSAAVRAAGAERGRAGVHSPRLERAAVARERRLLWRLHLSHGDRERAGGRGIRTQSAAAAAGLRDHPRGRVPVVAADRAAGAPAEAPRAAADRARAAERQCAAR